MEVEMEAAHGLTIPWPRVGIASIVIAVAACGALVIVTAVQDSEVLSTVALSLAILAFVIQILIFLAQSSANARAAEYIQGVNTETRAALSELRASSEGTQAALNDQFDKLLDRVLLATKESVAEVEEEYLTQGSLDDLRARLISDVREAVQSSRPVVTERRVPSENSPHEETLRRARTLPSVRMADRLAEDGLADLSPAAARQLARFALDVTNSAEIEVPEGLPASLSTPATAELLEKGVLRPRGTPNDGDEVFMRLSPKGKAAARFVTSIEPPTGKVVDLLPWLEEARAFVSSE